MVYNIDNGSLTWQVNIGESIHYQPAVSGSGVYIGTDSGKLYGINTDDPAATGWNLWGGSASHNGKEY